MAISAAKENKTEILEIVTSNRLLFFFLYKERLSPPHTCTPLYLKPLFEAQCNAQLCFVEKQLNVFRLLDHDRDILPF